ncbi:MAG: hypothetical protein ACON5F_01230 [Jejuia sp.]
MNIPEAELNNENWKYFELTYFDNNRPLLVEINQKNDSNKIVEEETEEFIDLIGKPKFHELTKKKVISLLKSTEFIICIQLPTTDITELGYDVNADLMENIANKFIGIVQADGESFYSKDKLILAVK